MWHLFKYQASEIFDLAVEIENRGGEFYKKLAQKTTNEQIKSLLLTLANEEAKHEVLFKEMGKKFAQVNASETYPGEYLEYLKLSVETHMFYDGDRMEQLVLKATSGLDIIELATNFEKDTIVFFNGLRNLVPKAKQGVIEDLIMEEQIHLIKLARMRKEVVAQDGK